MRHGKSLDENVADGELGTGAKNSPVPMSIQGVIAPDRFGSECVAVNRHGQFPAENFEATNVIAMLVREQNAIEILWVHAALLESKRNLSRAQSAINQNFAVVGRNQRTIPGAPAPEHGQTEHDRYLQTAIQFSQIKFLGRDEFARPGNARI